MRLTTMNKSRQVTEALAAVVLACSMAACGSTTSGTGGGGLCGQASQVTRLVVERAEPGRLIVRNHQRFAFPAEVTVMNPVKARSVAEAACALPPMPSAAVACPMDTGPIYRLVFSVGGTKLAPVNLDRTGCAEVRGLGQTRTTARSPGFWRVLRQAEGSTAGVH